MLTQNQNHKVNPVVIPRSEHCISREDISKNALKVLYRLHDAGYQAFLVGGCVRDLLLGGHPKDFDVVTDAHPGEIQKLFNNCRLIGRRFRLAHIHFPDEIIEVATFRGDPGVADDERVLSSKEDLMIRNNTYGTLEEDVWRRDFTINALYYNIADFSLVDYVNGVDDLKQRRIRLIGDAATRYQEDPVRLLRAIRFAAKLGFSIEQATEQPLHELGSLLGSVSSARLFEEVLKLFHSGNAVRTCELLRAYKVFAILFPQTAACLAVDDKGQIQTFLSLVLASTDARVQENKPVNPAFLFASFLWHPLLLKSVKSINGPLPSIIQMQKTGAAVIGDQVAVTAIPRRFTSMVREVWSFQHKLESYGGRHALSLLSNRRFRAAYDFLCLRSESGEETFGRCTWWREIQEKPPEEQEQLAEALVHRRIQRKSRRSKRRSGSGRRRRHTTHLN